MLEGLDLKTARLLLQREVANVSDGVCCTLHSAVRGNPLAMTEGGRLLEPRERSGLAPLPNVLRPGPSIEHAFSRRIARLSGPARRALLVAAAAEGSGAVEISAAMRELNLSLDGLDEAEQAGIVVLREAQVEFAHPLLRAVCYHAATASERRAVHRALATALADRAPTRSLLHLAAATVDPDERVAAALAAVATSGPSVSHAYSGPGTYTVSLTTTDSAGRSAFASQSITAGIPSKPPLIRHCVVPNLKGKSLAAARAGLRTSGCALGRVTTPKKPRRKPGRHRKWVLVVGREASRPGTVAPSGARVAIKLVYKVVHA